MFFHLIDIAFVNGFILFQENQANFPDDEDLQRPQGYSVELHILENPLGPV